MTTLEQRQERIHELRNEGVSIPPAVYAAMASDRAPSDLLRVWSWSAFIWDRPVLSQYSGGLENALAPDQDSWDTARQSISGSLELRAERAASAAAQARARQDADTALRASEFDELKAELRARFLRLPGSTAEEFETAFPTLLSDQRRRELDKAGASMQRDVQRLIAS